jgi:peptidoglycan/LPS O-acetylase OafA/YrhL
MVTKTHFALLDGLLGVAACMVVIFHLSEANAVSSLTQIINHGYLAVDFFFLLSGFVIGYAYDDRWEKLIIAGFFRKRLQRLQPMVVMGMFIGAVFFYFQASNLWPGIATLPCWKVMLVMVIGFFMIPRPPSMDKRGWSETYPLNGPAWSLLYEYIVNIVYGLLVRRFSKFWLSVLVLVSGIALIHFSITNHSGDLIGGWSLEPEQLRIGFTRVM